jgi:hypothetical protein
MRRTARSSTHQSAEGTLYGELVLKERLNLSDRPEPPKSGWFMLLAICCLHDLICQWSGGDTARDAS